jgi:CRP-like cAMP-binding protein
MPDERKIRKIRKQLETALAKNNEAAAIELLAALEKEEPRVPRWPHKRGDLLRKAGRRPEAIQCYAAAVELYADTGFIARAIAMAKTILNMDPSRIDILERVDPDAARTLHRQQRPGAVSDHPGADDQVMRHPMVLDDTARKPQRLAAPAAAAPAAAAPRRHPMLLDDDDAGFVPPPPTAARPAPPAATAQPAARKRHPMIIDDGDFPPLPPAPPAAPAAPAPPAARKRHPMIIDDDFPPLPVAPRAAPSEADPAQAFERTRPGRQLSARRHITLEKLSIPVPSATALRTSASATSSSDELVIPQAAALPSFGNDVPDVYDSMIAAELEIAPDAAPNEVRFSNAPPAMTVGVDVTSDEVTTREAITKEDSLPPQPSAARLSRLPLFPLFAEVPREALAELVRSSELIDLEHGALVNRMGEPADALFGIIEGSVSVVVPGQQLKLTLAEGDVFGEACLLPGEKRHADVVVQGRLLALRIPNEVLARLFKAHQRLAEVLLELLTRRLLGNLLHSSALFAEFDTAGRKELAQLFEIRRARRGIFLAEAGKKMDGLYINLTGTLEVISSGGSVQAVGPGHMCGQNGILGDEPARVSIRTATNMVVLRLTQQAFIQVAMQYPSILARVAELAQSEVVKVST